VGLSTGATKAWLYKCITLYFHFIFNWPIFRENLRRQLKQDLYGPDALSVTNQQCQSTEAQRTEWQKGTTDIKDLHPWLECSHKTVTPRWESNSDADTESLVKNTQRRLSFCLHVQTQKQSKIVTRTTLDTYACMSTLLSTCMLTNCELR